MALAKEYITNEYQSAVREKNVLRVKIMLKDILLIDRTFKQFDAMVKYAEENSLKIWIDDSEDVEEFSDSPDKLDLMLVGLVNSFSHRRVSHLKNMIQKQYPPKQQMELSSNGEKNKGGKVTKKISIIIKIKKENDNITNILKDIQSKINAGNSIKREDIKNIRSVANSIAELCDKILGK